MAKIDKITYTHDNTEYELNTFSPETPGNVGDVITKTADGYDWQAPAEVTVVSGDSGTTYTIKVSNSDPTSGTASNIITLVP